MGIWAKHQANKAEAAADIESWESKSDGEKLAYIKQHAHPDEVEYLKAKLMGGGR